MHFFRRMGLGLAAAIFSLLIFLFASFVSVYFVLDSAGSVKSALQGSGVYEKALQNAFKENQQAQGSGTLPATDAGAQAAVEQAFPPAELQRVAEQVIDGTYAWVHGDVAKPNFAVDLTTVKTRIADNLAAYLEQRLTALPVCPPQTAPQDVDQMLAEGCRPATASVPDLVAQARQQALDKGVLENSQINADTFKNEQGKSVFDAYKEVPEWHHAFMLSLFVMPLLIVLTAFAVVFASSTRRTGLRRLSVILLVTGIYSVAIALLAVWGLHKAAEQLSKQTNGVEGISDAALKFVTILANDLRTWWVGFAIAYLALGVAGLVTVRVLKKRTMRSVMSEEKKLDHNPDIPTAGTTFGPKSATPSAASSKFKKPPTQKQPPKKLQF